MFGFLNGVKDKAEDYGRGFLNLAGDTGEAIGDAASILGGGIVSGVKETGGDIGSFVSAIPTGFRETNEDINNFFSGPQAQQKTNIFDTVRNTDNLNQAISTGSIFETIAPERSLVDKLPGFFGEITGLEKLNDTLSATSGATERRQNKILQQTKSSVDDINRLEAGGVIDAIQATKLRAQAFEEQTRFLDDELEDTAFAGMENDLKKRIGVSAGVAGEVALNFVGVGTAKGLAKGTQALKTGGKEALKRGAKLGAAEGAAGGFFAAISDVNSQDPRSILINSTIGAGLGGALGAGVEGAGQVASKQLKKLVNLRGETRSLELKELDELEKFVTTSRADAKDLVDNRAKVSKILKKYNYKTEGMSAKELRETIRKSLDEATIDQSTFVNKQKVTFETLARDERGVVQISEIFDDSGKLTKKFEKMLPSSVTRDVIEDLEDVQKQIVAESALENPKMMDELLGRRDLLVDEVDKNIADDINVSNGKKSTLKNEDSPIPSYSDKGVKKNIPLYVPERQATDTIRDGLLMAGIDATQETIDQNMLRKALGVNGLKRGNAYRGLSDRASEAFNEKMTKAIASDNALTSFLAAAPRQFFAHFGNTKGVRRSIRVSKGTSANATYAAELFLTRARELANGLDEADLVESLNRVMREEGFLQRLGVERLDVSKLNPQEKQVYDFITGLSKQTNDANFEMGYIDKTQHARGANGHHVPRLQLQKGPDGSIVRLKNSVQKTGAFEERVEIAEMDDGTFDSMEKNPVLTIIMRWEETMRNKANFDALKTLEEVGLIKDKKPNKNFVKLEGGGPDNPKWGAFQDKYIEKTAMSQVTGERVFSSGIAQKIDEGIKWYQDQPYLGGVDRFMKKVVTVYNPGTAVGNVVSNPLVLNAGGINAISQTASMANAARKLVKHSSTMKNGKLTANEKFSKTIFEAREAGVLQGGSERLIPKREEQENFGPGSQKSTVDRLKYLANHPVSGLKKADELAQNLYGGSDEAAKLGMFTNLRNQGYSVADASDIVSRHTQDFGAVGNLVGILADSPILGAPFARFAPELIRITKNNTLRAPLRTAAGLITLGGYTSYMNANSGETPEERATREEGLGQTVIPGTAWLADLGAHVFGVEPAGRDISLNIPLNAWGVESSLDVARFIGMNFPLNSDMPPEMAIISQLIPASIPYGPNNQGDWELNPRDGISSMWFGHIAEQIMNVNFLGRQLTDPTNPTHFNLDQELVVHDKDGNVIYKDDAIRGINGEPTNPWLNRARAAGHSFIPGFSTVDNIAAGVRGEKSITGKERTPGDAALRGVLGLKLQKNDAESREDRVQVVKYFEGTVADINKFLSDNPDLENDYWNLFLPTKDRETGKKVSDILSKDKWRTLAEHAGAGDMRLFEFAGEAARKQREADINDYAKRIEEAREVGDAAKVKELESRTPRPVHPVYGLEGDQRQIVLSDLANYSGDSDDLDDRYGNQEWYKNYREKMDTYYEESGKYWDAVQFDGDDIRNETVKAYGELNKNSPYNDVRFENIGKYYDLIDEVGQDAADLWKDANIPQSMWDEYKEEIAIHTNKKRELEGALPLSEEELNEQLYSDESDGGYKREQYYSRSGSSNSSSGGSSGSTSSVSLANRNIGKSSVQSVAGSISAPSVRGRTKSSYSKNSSALKIQTQRANI